MVPSALSATAGATLLSPETAQRAAHTHELRAFDERAGKGPRSQLLDSEVPVWLAFERGLQSTLNDTRTSAHGLLLQSILLEATLSFGPGAFQGRLARLRERRYSDPFFSLLDHATPSFRVAAAAPSRPAVKIGRAHV